MPLTKGPPRSSWRNQTALASQKTERSREKDRFVVKPTTRKILSSDPDEETTTLRLGVYLEGAPNSLVRVDHAYLRSEPHAAPARQEAAGCQFYVGFWTHVVG